MKLSKKQYNTVLLILKIYWKYSAVGGALHIVLDDGNIDNDSIIFCLNEIRKINWVDEHTTYKECAENLLSMTMAYRRKTIGVAWDILSINRPIFKYEVEVLNGQKTT
jgi:hypothetical protein